MMDTQLTYIPPPDATPLVSPRVKTKKTKEIMTVTGFEYLKEDLNYHTFFTILFFRFFSGLLSTENIYETLKAVFDQISKQLEFRQKYSVMCRIFNRPFARSGHMVQNHTCW